MHATILSTYPPRGCGLATFARDLRAGLASAGVTADVVASVRTAGDPGRAPEVSREVVQDQRSDYAAAARALDPSTDVVCVQHEFGIFGGPEGTYVTDFMRASAAPVVTTLHTVLPTPPAHYRRALLVVAEASDRLVVMTETARTLLREVYRVPASRVSVVPHGTPVVTAPAPDLRARLGLEGRTVLLTFGLLGPSKGIEFALDALAPVAQAHPDVLYVVLGATHPEIVAREGEAYRESLQATVDARGLGDHVRFVDRYLDGPELGDWLLASDVYVSPYPSMDQICSGTLAYALAAGLPVVSTPYLHAAEVLADGAGALVPYGDTEGFAAALARFAESPHARAEAGRRAREIGAPTAWPETGRAYRRVFEEVIAEAARRPRLGPRSAGAFSVHPGALPAALDALDRLTDDVGPVQHTVYGVPDRRHGYSADDAARALVAAYGAIERVGRPPASLLRLTQTCLAFLRHAQRPDGAFHNFMSFDRRFLDSRGGDDTTGRAIWGLGATVRWAPDAASQHLALELVERALADDLHHPCARAYAITGLDLALGAVPDHGSMRAALARLAGGLADQFERTQAPDWRWFSDAMTYANALPPARPPARRRAPARPGRALARDRRRRGPVRPRPDRRRRPVRPRRQRRLADARRPPGHLRPAAHRGRLRRLVLGRRRRAHRRPPLRRRRPAGRRVVLRPQPPGRALVRHGQRRLLRRPDARGRQPEPRRRVGHRGCPGALGGRRPRPRPRDAGGGRRVARLAGAPEPDRGSVTNRTARRPTRALRHGMWWGTAGP